ncbi:Uncharacterised protein [Acinetobacter baumannii]|nr:Uncharacterised protein [Acinetobacter baumannii]
MDADQAGDHTAAEPVDRHRFGFVPDQVPIDRGRRQRGVAGSPGGGVGEGGQVQPQAGFVDHRAEFAQADVAVQRRAVEQLRQHLLQRRIVVVPAFEFAQPVHQRLRVFRPGALGKQQQEAIVAGAQRGDAVPAQVAADHRGGYSEAGRATARIEAGGAQGDAQRVQPRTAVECLGEPVPALRRRLPAGLDARPRVAPQYLEEPRIAILPGEPRGGFPERPAKGLGDVAGVRRRGSRGRLAVGRGEVVQRCRQALRGAPRADPPLLGRRQVEACAAVVAGAHRRARDRRGIVAQPPGARRGAPFAQVAVDALGDEACGAGGQVEASLDLVQ